MAKSYYLTFRSRKTLPLGTPSVHPMGIEYGNQANVFTERAPLDAYKVLKAAGFCAAYGREGERPIRDTHPCEPWDCDAAENKPSGVKS